MNQDIAWEIAVMVCIIIVGIALILWSIPASAQTWQPTLTGFAVAIIPPAPDDMEPCLPSVPGAQGFPPRPRMCPRARLSDQQVAEWS